jgi:hypothetical protein
MREAAITSAFLAAAAVLAVVASVVAPESTAPEILSDQGELFYPKFTDPQSARTIEVVDYDEATASARPLKVVFERGRWVIASSHNYPIDVGDRLVKTAAAVMDLRKDLVRSDAVQDHGQFGVIDPLDQKSPSLTGRGKRVTLRNAQGDVLADFILGKAVEGKPGYRYLRVPDQKRTYAVKTAADPSASFADWVNADLLRIAAANIRKVTINSYQIDEAMGRLANLESIALLQEKGQWKGAGGEAISAGAARTMAAALDGLKIVDVRPKPPTLAEDLRKGEISLTLEAAMSLRQKGFYLSPNGRLLANEGEMNVETADGLLYSLRFGEVATSAGEVKPAASAGENRHVLVLVNFDPQRAAKYGGDAAAGERAARELNNRFAGWYFVISGADFQRLRPRRSELVRNPTAEPRRTQSNTH